jgi:hypothetical protein
MHYQTECFQEATKQVWFKYDIFASISLEMGKELASQGEEKAVSHDRR